MEIIDRRVTKMKMISPSNREVRSALRRAAPQAGRVAPRARDVMLPAALGCAAHVHTKPAALGCAAHVHTKPAADGCGTALPLRHARHACSCNLPNVLMPRLQVDVGKTLNEKEWIGMCRREVRCAGC